MFVNRGKQVSWDLWWTLRLGSLNSYATILWCRVVGDRNKTQKLPDGLIARFLEANEMLPIRCTHTSWGRP